MLHGSLAAAAGNFCSGCACTDCLNVVEQAELVKKEVHRALLRNPTAFIAKVRPRLQNDFYFLLGGGVTVFVRGSKSGGPKLKGSGCRLIDGSGVALGF